MKIGFLLLCLAFVFSSCVSSVTVTDSYIINKNWNAYNYELTVARMQVIKGISSIDPDTAVVYDLLTQLEVDSSYYYCFFSGMRPPKEMVKKKKLYFTHSYPGNFWQFGCPYFESKMRDQDKAVLGKLQRNVWYRFSSIVTYRYYVFVYFDSKGRVHQYAINQTNF